MKDYKNLKNQHIRRQRRENLRLFVESFIAATLLLLLFAVIWAITVLLEPPSFQKYGQIEWHQQEEARPYLQIGPLPRSSRPRSL